MKQERLEMVKNYLNCDVPILLEDIPANIFDGAVILNADCDNSLLNGRYEGTEFIAPNWYNQLIEKSKTNHPLLIISDISKISKEEQSKFAEILKYKKISTFDLPQNCIIIVTCSNLKENKINEEIYSLLAHI